MYELGAGVGAAANLAFGLIGIWMAHSLYRTSRKRWQAVAAWALVFLVWTFGATLLWPLLPWMTYARVSMLVGFSGIFVYLYLFQTIPISQRVFTYFMVDTSMTLLVLFSRMASILLAQWLHFNADLLFLAVYVPLTLGFLLLFRFVLREYILSALQAFSSHLTGLAIFAAVGYVTLLLLVDPWVPWAALNIWTAMGWLGLIGFVLAGYALAFRTLIEIRAQDAAVASERRLMDQLTLSEQYYDSLVERVERARMYNHDLRHHINALNGLCAAEQWDEVRSYVAGMGAELPRSLPTRWCKDGAVNAVLDHYADLCREAGIAFRCQLQIPVKSEIQPLHLCVILGNALQNALEASQKLPVGVERYIEVKAAPTDGKLAISVANRCGNIPVPDGAGGFCSTKTESGHGLGLGSIRATAHHYDGWCGVAWEDGVVTLRVTLNCNS